MKKTITKAILIAMMAMNLAACGSNIATCDFCGEEKACSTIQVLGEDMNICKDCEKEFSSYK